MSEPLPTNGSPATTRPNAPQPTARALTTHPSAPLRTAAPHPTTARCPVVPQSMTALASQVRPQASHVGSGWSTATAAVPRFRGRIGTTESSGFYAAPHRYHLYLALSCPGSLRVAITHRLLDLSDQVHLTELPPTPDTPAGFGALRPFYEATEYRYSGPLAVPLLVDGWSGRIVSNHVPDLLRDLSQHFSVGSSGTPRPRPELYPTALDAPQRALETLIEEDVEEAAQRAGAAPAHYRDGEPLQTLLDALGVVDDRLASGPFLFGDALTAADVQLWVALVRLDTVHRRHLDAAAVRQIAGYRRLWAYLHRLYHLPAFQHSLRLDQIGQWHRGTCRGPESSGAAVSLTGW